MKAKPFKPARTILSLIVVLIFLVAFCGDVLARGSSSRSSSSSSSRSFSSSSSRSSSSTTSTPSSSSSSSSSSWGGKSSSAGLTTSGARGAKPADSSSEATSSKSATASTASMSKADKALYEQAKTKGTAFKTRDEATSAFKQQNESKYQNQFASEPTRRPDHIPEYYNSPSGTRYSVGYRPELGGYGYYDSSLGRWMLYSVMADAAMTSLLMRNHGYYHGPPPAVHYGGGWGFFSWLGAFILVGLIVAAVVRFSQVRRRI